MTFLWRPTNLHSKIIDCLCSFSCLFMRSCQTLIPSTFSQVLRRPTVAPKTCSPLQIVVPQENVALTSESARRWVVEVDKFVARFLVAEQHVWDCWLHWTEYRSGARTNCDGSCAQIGKWEPTSTSQGNRVTAWILVRVQLVALTAEVCTCTTEDSSKDCVCYCQQIGVNWHFCPCHCKP